MSKPDLTIILSKLKKKPVKETSPLDALLKKNKASEYDHTEETEHSVDDGLTAAADDLIKAVESKNTALVVEALRDMHDLLCDSCVSEDDSDDPGMEKDNDVSSLLDGQE
jgi:hypothetical protein